MEKTSACEWVQQKKSSGEEAASVERTSHQWNTKEMRVVLYNVSYLYMYVSMYAHIGKELLRFSHPKHDPGSNLTI